MTIGRGLHMNQTIEAFGRLVDSRAQDHPEQAAALLGTVYRLIGQQALHFPSKKRTSSREFLQGYTATLMADMLKDPSQSAVVNIFMPSEIFHAMDIPIMAPEALATYVACTAAEQIFLDRAMEAGASETLCSFHRCLLGMAETGVMKKPLFVANTTLACDANQLTFRQLAQKWNVPHVVIDVPYEPCDEAVEYVAGQLRDMTALAEELTGRKMDPGRLALALKKSRRTMRNYRKYMEARPFVHFPEALTPELELAICNHLFLGTDAAVTFTGKLLRDVGNAPRLTSQKKILWMHMLPNWQNSMCEIFQGAENRDVEIIGSEMAFSSLTKTDPEHPYETMAKRLVYDSFNGPGSRRIERMLRMARKTGADGILIFCQWGCKQTQGISMAAKQAFEAEGFPTLILDGDACDRTKGGSEQIVTRANAFVEQLQKKDTK